jgi:hypothetical protein
MVNPFNRPVVMTLTIRYDDIGDRTTTITVAPGGRWALPLSHPDLRGPAPVTTWTNAGVKATCDIECSLLVTNWFGNPGTPGAFATTYEPRPMCPP